MFSLDTSKPRITVEVIALISLLIHLVLTPSIAIGQGHINPLVVAALSVALLYGGRYGVIFGFIAGLVYDLTGTGPIGLMSLELCIACYILGLGLRNRFNEKRSTVFQMMIPAIFALSCIYAFALSLVTHSMGIFDALAFHALPEAVLSSLLAIPYVILLSKGARFANSSNSARKMSIPFGGRPRHLGS